MFPFVFANTAEFEFAETWVTSVKELMWNASGNNMVVGTDMTVDTSPTATNLFTVTSTGQNKLRQPVYTSFKGKSYSTSLLFYVILLTEN